MRACGSGLWRDRGFAGDSQWASVAVTEAEVSGLSLPPPAEFLTSGSTTAAVAAAAAAFHCSLREPTRESTFRHIDRISSITARLIGKFKAPERGTWRRLCRQNFTLWHIQCSSLIFSPPPADENPQLTGGQSAANQGCCRKGHWVCKHDEEKSLTKEAERQTFIAALQEYCGLQNFTRMEGR